MPVRAADAKTSTVPFPCQSRPCGCLTAEKCWAGPCCCFSMKEKFAWAAARGVRPPDRAAREMPEAPAGKKPGACCAETRKPRSNPLVRVVSGLHERQCRGGPSDGLGAAPPAQPPPPPAAWSFDRVLVAVLAGIDAAAESHTSPPVPPPPRA